VALLVVIWTTSSTTVGSVDGGTITVTASFFLRVKTSMIFPFKEKRSQSRVMAVGCFASTNYTNTLMSQSGFMMIAIAPVGNNWNESTFLIHGDDPVHSLDFISGHFAKFFFCVLRCCVTVRLVKQSHRFSLSFRSGANPALWLLNLFS
jgi:hypothetical protein